MSESECPSPDEFRRYAAGNLDYPAWQAIADHIEDCSLCQALIATIDDADDTLVSCLRRVRSLESYEQDQAYHEAVVNKILDDLSAACQPRFMEIVGEFYVRGGIRTTVSATEGKSDAV